MKGFTLIELMLVVIIVAVLLSVAVPAYQQQLIQTRRSIGKAELLSLQARQEQFFVDNKRYAKTLVSLGLNSDPSAINQAGDEVGITSPKRTYRMSIVSVSTIAFTLAAQPQLGQARDSLCAKLTLDSTGVKSSGGSGTLADCW